MNVHRRTAIGCKGWTTGADQADRARSGNGKNNAGAPAQATGTRRSSPGRRTATQKISPAVRDSASRMTAVTRAFLESVIIGRFSPAARGSAAPKEPSPLEEDDDLLREDPPLPERATMNNICISPRQAAPPVTARQISSPTPPTPATRTSRTGMVPPAPPVAAAVPTRAGGALPSSARATGMIWPAPSLIPPAKSPVLRAGRIAFSVISFVAAAVSFPHRP